MNMVNTWRKEGVGLEIIFQMATTTGHTQGTVHMVHILHQLRTGHQDHMYKNLKLDETCNKCLTGHGVKRRDLASVHL